MKAYHVNPKFKQFYLDRVEAHAKADEIIQGTYWENGKGCAVGCTIHSEDLFRYESELGIPQILAEVEDRIFEGLPNELAKTWPSRFLEAIPPGADLSLIWDRFAVALLTDPVWGVIQYAKTAKQMEVIQRVSDLYQQKISGINVDQSEFHAAADAAEAAYAHAVHAADAAAVAHAVHAADAAAVAHAAYAAASTHTTAYAYAAVAATAYTAAHAASREKAYIWQSELLLKLLKEASL